MSVAAYRKFKPGFPLALVPAGIGNQSTPAQQPLPANKIVKLLSSKIFGIRFKYLQKAVHMKVLKIVYRSGETIYKIALNSALCKWNNICWLQRRLQGWVILLGPETDEKLKSAITSAIEQQELTT